MTREEREFVRWYRKFFRNEKELPCLKCSDKKIVKCSNIDIGIHGSCYLFYEYVYKKDRESSEKRVFA
jgi:hypothetical protein